MPDPEGLTAAASLWCDETGLDHSNGPSLNPDVCPGVKNDQNAELKQLLAQEEKIGMASHSCAFQQHNHVAMGLLSQLNSKTACMEMLGKSLFLSTEKRSFPPKTFLFKFCSFYQKLTICIFSPNYATIPYTAVFRERFLRFRSRGGVNCFFFSEYLINIFH